jgi:hypothetical protein
VASDKYGIIDHIDVMNAIFRSLPGGKDDALCSSYYNDGDTMGGNVILPDYIKKRPDSEYGVGFSFGNSEIRNKAFTIKSYLYRAIDSSGYIYGSRQMNLSIALKHFGKIDFQNVKKLVGASINTALNNGENMIVFFDYAKSIKIESALRIIVALTREFKMTISQGKKWYKNYVNGNDIGTSLGIINSLAITAKEFKDETKECMEQFAANLLVPNLNYTAAQLETRWNNINSKSQLIDVKIIKQYEI